MKKLWKLILAFVLLVTLWTAGCRPAGNATLGPEISGHELGYLLKVHPDFSATGTVVDEDYRLVRPSWVKANINVASFGDCDDWALAAFYQSQRYGRRVAFGMITTSHITSDNKLGGHAHCFFVDPDKKIWMYEPQTGRCWLPSKEELWMLGKYWI